MMLSIRLGVGGGPIDACHEKKENKHTLRKREEDQHKYLEAKQ